MNSHAYIRLKKYGLRLIAIGLILIIFSQVQAQSVTKEDYQQAEKFLPQNAGNLVFRASVNPHWTNDAPVFWYRTYTRKGEQYFLINADKQTKKPFFNQQKLAQNLSSIFHEKVDPYDLPIHHMQWNYAKRTFKFWHKNKMWVVNLSTLNVSKVQGKNSSDHHRFSSTSPNGNWTVTQKNYNLTLKNNKTGAETQLTIDGEKLFLYGARLPWSWEKQVGPKATKRKPLSLHISWSRDSQHFYAGKLDLRKAKKMYLLQNVPAKGLRSRVFSYYRALPGEDSVATISPYVFNVQTKKKTAIQIPPYDQVTRGRWIWSDSKLYSIQRSRGYDTITLLQANTTSGEVDTLFHRTSDTYIDPLNNEYKFLPKTNELVWLSERSGWNQIYIYDLETGNLENRATQGDYIVSHLVNVDPKHRTIYFTAGAREVDHDPYYKYLYRVNFGGNDLKLLTPENATHNVSLSPDRNYFVDRYSRVNQKPKTVLRNARDGSVLMSIEEADIKDLLATGWHYPEAFKLKARDDSTNIYGVMYRPSNFNPDKKYPIIDHIYAGPQAVMTPKSFDRGYQNSDQSLAELGFIIINVDGLGTAQRSKKFHDFSYKNLGDASLPDHIKTIKYLARKYSYIDTSSVGIYGHSAGGYDAARAMLAYPNFFKVGVAESGDHDLRIAKAWWPELYMGYPIGSQYKKQTNMKLADNLKGYLLLAHGGMDTNVHPAETYRLSKSLIKAGKSFDMFIIPNVSHGYGYADMYWTRYRWNYFIEHLMGSQPLSNLNLN